MGIFLYPYFWFGKTFGETKIVSGFLGDGFLLLEISQQKRETEAGEEYQCIQLEKMYYRPIATILSYVDGQAEYLHVRVFLLCIIDQLQPYCHMLMDELSIYMDGYLCFVSVRGSKLLKFEF